MTEVTSGSQPARPPFDPASYAAGYEAGYKAGYHDAKHKAADIAELFCEELDQISADSEALAKSSMPRPPAETILERVTDSQWHDAYAWDTHTMSEAAQLIEINIRNMKP